MSNKDPLKTLYRYTRRCLYFPETQRFIVSRFVLSYKAASPKSLPFLHVPARFVLAFQKPLAENAASRNSGQTSFALRSPAGRGDTIARHPWALNTGSEKVLSLLPWAMGRSTVPVRTLRCAPKPTLRCTTMVLRATVREQSRAYDRPSGCWEPMAWLR